MFVQFFTFVFALNMVGIVVACTHHFPYAEQHGAALALGNILAAVFCRNEFFNRNLRLCPSGEFVKGVDQPFISEGKSCVVRISK